MQPGSCPTIVSGNRNEGASRRRLTSGIGHSRCPSPLLGGNHTLRLFGGRFAAILTPRREGFYVSGPFDTSNELRASRSATSSGRWGWLPHCPHGSNSLPSYISGY